MSITAEAETKTTTQPKEKAKTEAKPDPHFLQRAMFRAVRSNKVEVYVTTVSGKIHLGTIVDQDQFTVELKTGKSTIWFYKHGIESIQVVQD